MDRKKFLYAINISSGTYRKPLNSYVDLNHTGASERFYFSFGRRIIYSVCHVCVCLYEVATLYSVYGVATYLCLIEILCNATAVHRYEENDRW